MNRSPASYAWDIILGNSMDKEIIDFLRAAFSERDFLEEQNFNLAHEIVLGLNGRRLADAIEERPNLTDSADTRGNTPLIWAARRGDTASLQELLKHGASVEFRNNNGWNALYTAVNHSRLDCTTTLLSYGYTDHKDGYGMTALHRACQQSDATFVQLLLEHDLNVDEQDVFQRCPLALAAWRNNALGVQYLLDSRADRETRDIFGATPLLRAIQYAAVDAARVLLENKRDVLAVDHESQTLLHRAALPRDIPTIKLLSEKSHTLRNVETNAKSISGRTAAEQLQTIEPSAELLRAFTTMLTALESARMSARQTERTLLKNLNTDDQDIFKDAIEFQSDGSPASSCPSTDNESLAAKRRRREKTRLTKSLDRLGRNWASKYRDTFRTFDRASTSTLRLGGAHPIANKG